MCLAIAPNRQPNNSLLSRSWHNIASSPLRLFSFAALFHLLITIGIMAHSSITGTDINIQALITGLSFALVPLVMFGFLLTWVPQKHSIPPVHYGRYNIIYLFFMSALILLELGSLISNNLIVTGMLLLLPAWVIALQSVWYMHSWVRSDAQIFSKLLLLLLILNLVILVIEISGQFSDVLLFAGIALVSLTILSSTILWSLVLIFSVLLVTRAPARGRVISI